MSGLRKAINEKCKSCIHDNLAAGTWLQQVTLCSVDLCLLRDVRPKTNRPIPESVFSYYGVDSLECQQINEEISATNTSKDSEGPVP
jgi:hypothetical protein